MVDKIATIVIGVIFSVPIVFAILYLIALLFKRRDFQNSRMTFYIKKIVIVFAILMAIFMLYFIVMRFMFPSISIPKFIESFGLLLFLLSFGSIGGIMLGFANAREAGFSPRSVSDEIFKLFSKESTSTIKAGNGDEKVENSGKS